MPTYAYKCESCSHMFDKVVKIADREIPVSDPCPACGSQGSVARNFQDCNQAWTDPYQLGRVKPNADWRNWLTNLKKANPGSDFNHA